MVPGKSGEVYLKINYQEQDTKMTQLKKTIKMIPMVSHDDSLTIRCYKRTNLSKLLNVDYLAFTTRYKPYSAFQVSTENGERTIISKTISKSMNIEHLKSKGWTIRYSQLFKLEKGVRVIIKHDSLEITITGLYRNCKKVRYSMIIQVMQQLLGSIIRYNPRIQPTPKRKYNYARSIILKNNWHISQYDFNILLDGPRIGTELMQKLQSKASHVVYNPTNKNDYTIYLNPKSGTGGSTIVIYNRGEKYANYSKAKDVVIEIRMRRQVLRRHQLRSVNTNISTYDMSKFTSSTEIMQLLNKSLRSKLREVFEKANMQDHLFNILNISNRKNMYREMLSPKYSLKELVTNEEVRTGKTVRISKNLEVR